MPKSKDQAKPQISSYLTLTEKELPEIKSWKVGEIYHVMLEVKQVGASAGDSMGVPVDGEDSQPAPHEARFKVVSAKVMGGNQMGSEEMGPDEGMPGEGEMGDTQESGRKKVIQAIGQKAQTA